MAAALQLLKSISRRRQERQDLEMQMFLTQKSEPRKRKLQMMEDDEIDTAKAIGLCAVRAKRRVEHKCVLVYDFPSLYQTTLMSEMLKVVCLI